MRILYFEWGKTGKLMKPNAFKKIMPTLKQTYTGVNLSLGDKLCPEAAKPYPYQTNYETAGMDDFIIHHKTPDFTSELTNSPKK